MNDMQNFNPQAFLDATIDAPSVRRPPLPPENPASPDGLYPAMLGEPKARTWNSNKDGQQRSGMAFDVPVTVTVPQEVATGLGLQPPFQVTINDSIMLDLNPQGGIDNAPGRNGRMRLYREAVDLNKPGDTFSFRKLAGKPVRVKIKHDMYEGEFYDKIATVAKI